MPPIDVDQHLFEPRDMWARYIDPSFADGALSIEDDLLGYPWLTWRGKQLYLADVQVPGKAKPLAEIRQALKRGEPAPHRYDEQLPRSYWDPSARVAALDEFGLSSTVVFPNFGLLWEDMLSSDVPSLCANMRAFNRWMADVVAEGSGRLFGVGHLSLRDRSWAVDEIENLANAGIKLAMVAPAPVDGVALSHPSLDEVWAAFSACDVAPVFHVGGYRKVFDPCWYQADPEPVDKVLDSAMLWVAPALALGAMIVYGTLEKFPRLRIGVVEMTAHWVPEFLLMLEGALGFYTARHGEPPMRLELSPSEYFRRQVRVAALAYEQPARLIELAGEDIFMFGSDWPHAEGIADPLRTYESVVPDLSESAKSKLFSGNARWLLGLREPAVTPA